MSKITSPFSLLLFFASFAFFLDHCPFKVEKSRLVFILSQITLIGVKTRDEMSFTITLKLLATLLMNVLEILSHLSSTFQ